MTGADPRIDAYIAAAQPFARPVLDWLRAQVHAACPQVVETIKWSMPFFMLGGRPFANMAAFKAHASFGFWRGGKPEGAEGMGQFGRIASLADLPAEAEFHALIARAAALAAEAGPRPARHPKPEIAVPPALAEGLAASSAARATWDGFPPSCRREYLDWIDGAKRPDTRTKRIAATLAQLAEGKRQGWKYEKR